MNAAQLPMGVNVALFAVSAVIVWLAGTKLARYADAIADRTGLGREFLGVLLLGGVTSLPEVAVAVTATMQGTPLLSISDVLGSAAINVVILAAADAIIGRGPLTSMLASPLVMLQGVFGIVVLAIVVAAIVTDDAMILGMGAWSWLMLAFYLASIRMLSKSQAGAAWQPAGRRHGLLPESSKSELANRSPRQLTVQTVAAGAGILIAGSLLAHTGEALAEQTGLGTSFFGAVFLGFSTSLPEVSTVVAAVRIRRYEMAISDVFGTNLFNVTIIVLVDALHPGGPVLRQAGPFAAFSALLALALTAFFLAGMIERRDRVVLRMGVDSVAVLVAYCAGVVVLHGLR